MKNMKTFKKNRKNHIWSDDISWILEHHRFVCNHIFRLFFWKEKNTRIKIKLKEKFVNAMKNRNKIPKYFFFIYFI